MLNQTLEHRRDPRVKVFWPVNLVRQDRTQYAAKTSNASAGGLQISTVAPVKKGEKVLIFLNAYFAGKNHELKFIGKVAYTTFKEGRELSVGIQVISKRSDFKEVIEEFVQQYI